MTLKVEVNVVAVEAQSQNIKVFLWGVPAGSPLFYRINLKQLKKESNKMKGPTLKQKSVSALWSDRDCAKCPLSLQFEHYIQTMICEQCSKSFIEGYKKGYKQVIKEISHG